MNRGIFLLVFAELCFASATVFAKFVTNNSDIPAVIEITFKQGSPGRDRGYLLHAKNQNVF